MTGQRQSRATNNSYLIFQGLSLLALVLLRISWRNRQSAAPLKICRALADALNRIGLFSPFRIAHYLLRYRIADSRPSRVSGYIWSPTSWRVIPSEPPLPQ